MRTAMRKGRSRGFSTEVEAFVQVDIDAEELEEAGWVYVGEEGAPGYTVEYLERLIREVHDDEHQGPLRWCTNPLCREVS